DLPRVRRVADLVLRRKARHRTVDDRLDEPVAFAVDISRTEKRFLWFEGKVEPVIAEFVMLAQVAAHSLVDKPAGIDLAERACPHRSPGGVEIEKLAGVEFDRFSRRPEGHGLDEIGFLVAK